MKFINIHEIHMHEHEHAMYVIYIWFCMSFMFMNSTCTYIQIFEVFFSAWVIRRCWWRQKFSISYTISWTGSCARSRNLKSCTQKHMLHTHTHTPARTNHICTNNNFHKMWRELAFPLTSSKTRYLAPNCFFSRGSTEKNAGVNTMLYFCTKPKAAEKKLLILPLGFPLSWGVSRPVCVCFLCVCVPEGSLGQLMISPPFSHDEVPVF